MLTRRNELPGFARNGAYSFAAGFILIGFVPALVAQQYCVSGAITSVLSCNGCSFKVGDPVAMTFTVKPSSITCNSTPFGSHCLADTAFGADIGGRHWTDSPDALRGSVDMSASVNGGIGSPFTSSVGLSGTGYLSGTSLGGSFTIPLFPGNLLPTGTLPAALPSPDAVAASRGIAQFTALGDAIANVSYTGQNCATGSAAAPTINTGGVVPLYSSTNTIQPGSWVSIFGTNLAVAAATWNSDFPTSLGGTSVTINGKPAYLWFVSPGQINLQAPDDTATGSVSVVVTTAGGSTTSNVTLAQFSPSFSQLPGKHVSGIILRSDGSGAYGGGTYDIVGPTGTSLGYKTVAAKPGDTLELFGVGFGPTNPPVPAGKAYTGAAATTNPVQLSINNVAVTAAFAGLTSAGLYQINLTLPAGLGSGDVPLDAVVGGVHTPTGVVLSVQ